MASDPERDFLARAVAALMPSFLARFAPNFRGMSPSVSDVKAARDKTRIDDLDRDGKERPARCTEQAGRRHHGCVPEAGNAVAGSSNLRAAIEK